MTVLCGHVFHLRCMKSLCDGTDHKNIYHVKCPVCAFDPTAVVDSGGGLASWRSSMGAMLVQHILAPCAMARTRKKAGTVCDGSDHEEGRQSQRARLKPAELQDRQSHRARAGRRLLLLLPTMRARNPRLLRPRHHRAVQHQWQWTPIIHHLPSSQTTIGPRFFR